VQAVRAHVHAPEEDVLAARLKIPIEGMKEKSDTAE